MWMESVRCVISFQGFECTLTGRSSLERTFWNIFLFKVGKNSTHPQFHADLEHTILHVKTFMCDETSRYTGQKFGQPQQKTKNKKQKTTSCVCTDLKHTQKQERFVPNQSSRHPIVSEKVVLHCFVHVPCHRIIVR